MVILSIEETNVLERAKVDMLNADSIDTINKIYRQVRVWNRWHSIGLNRPFNEDPTYVTINESLKQIRNEAREKLNAK